MPQRRDRRRIIVTMASSSVNNTFVHQMQRMLEWIDTDAQHLSKEEVLDGARVRMLVMVKKFIAFPHCHNFSLMQQPADQLPGGGA